MKCCSLIGYFINKCNRYNRIQLHACPYVSLSLVIVVSDHNCLWFHISVWWDSSSKHLNLLHNKGTTVKLEDMKRNKCIQDSSSKEQIYFGFNLLQ